MYLTLISELYSKIGKPVGYALIWPTMKRLCAAEQSMASYGFLALNRYNFTILHLEQCMFLDQKALKECEGWR